MITYLIPYRGIARQHEPCKEFSFMEKEIWKDIIGFEGLYQVSNTGKVKSLKRFIPSNGLMHPRINPERILRQAQDRNGYHFVTACVNYEKKRFDIHRLLAIHFIPNPNNKSEVNHINGHKHDNRISNLEWCTVSENVLHAYDLGLNTSRRKIIQCTLTGELLQGFSSIVEASRRLNFKRTSINNVLAGRSPSLNGFIFKYS